MGTTTYDKLSRGRKQEIDLKRRKALKEAKDMPKSRVGDTVSDAVAAFGGFGLMPGKGGARAYYKAGRDKAIKAAEEKAAYKDLKKKPTKLFRDKNAKGMSDDELSKLGDFKVEEYKKGGPVKGYGMARGGRACKIR